MPISEPPGHVGGSLLVRSRLAYTPAVAAATRVEPCTRGGRSLAGAFVGPGPAREPSVHTEEGTETVQNSGQLLILAVFVVFAVWVLSRGRRQQRETVATQSRVHVGTEVMMTSGLYGTVVETGEDGTIRLETSPGTVSRWDRRAVARIVSSPEEPAEPEVSPSAQSVAPAEPVALADPVEPARPVQDAAPPDRD